MMRSQTRFWTAVAVGLAGAACAAVLGGRPSATADDAAKEHLTFNKEIAPIVFQECASCHRPGEVAPFSLLCYEDVKKRAPQIALVTHSRLMPPWQADSHGEFQNERRLTDEQIRKIRQWVDEGAPEGSGDAAPKPPKFAEGWQLGQPDAVFEPEESFSVPADGPDLYRCFVIPTRYGEDRYVSAVEVRPGNRSVVHHVLVFLDTSGAARKLDAADPGPGYTHFGGVGFLPTGGLGGWAPGNIPALLPKGVGTLLPKDADIVLQVHYHKTGKPEADRTKIGVYFSKGPVDKRVRVAPVLHRALQIPAGDSNYVVEAGMPVPADVTVLGVTPHMHLLGREMTVTAALPDGTQKPLVRVPDWNFNWQTTYSFQEPRKLPKGSRIHLVARYDNSENNPRNPNHPPRLVTWGEQTTDEMCIAFVAYTVDAEQLTKGIAAGGLGADFFGRGSPAGSGLRQGALQQILKQFDKNGNGRLDPDERAELMKGLRERRNTAQGGPE
jgi:hypothetical protein